MIPLCTISRCTCSALHKHAASMSADAPFFFFFFFNRNDFLFFLEPDFEHEQPLRVNDLAFSLFFFYPEWANRRKSGRGSLPPWHNWPSEGPRPGLVHCWPPLRRALHLYLWPSWTLHCATFLLFIRRRAEQSGIYIHLSQCGCFVFFPHVFANMPCLRESIDMLHQLLSAEKATSQIDDETVSLWWRRRRRGKEEEPWWMDSTLDEKIIKELFKQT